MVYVDYYATKEDINKLLADHTDETFQVRDFDEQEEEPDAYGLWHVNDKCVDRKDMHSICVDCRVRIMNDEGSIFLDAFIDTSEVQK